MPGDDTRGIAFPDELGSLSPSASRSTALISRVLVSKSEDSPLLCGSASVGPESRPSAWRGTGPDASLVKLYAIDIASAGSSGRGGGGAVGARVRGTLSDGTRIPPPRRRRRLQIGRAH